MPADSFPNSKFLQQLEAIKNNSEPHLRELYRYNYKTVEKYVVQNSGTADEAKDIFQEAFIAVWRNIQLEKFIPQTENSLNAYIFQVSKNKWISYLRSAMHKKTIGLSGQEEKEMEVEEINVADKDQLDAIAENIHKLGDNCREILKRFYYNKESLRAIAAIFNWTEATARNNKYRCIEKLRNLLKN
ncbi:MAG: sigma-70 family RNA polymerase sigma factor [Rhizobacter sp.]|nr:sigma-70 family RNA polymerase sigma factor [Ferruginibacter sp.]